MCVGLGDGKSLGKIGKMGVVRYFLHVILVYFSEKTRKKV
jgi:hypothetical protein